MRWLPGIDTIRRYQLAWLPHDLFAGLVLATMLVPVGIAYAAASGLPGIHGLYATLIPLLAYALFGPSRILVLGPDSAFAAVILGVVGPLSGGDPVRAATLAAMMALVSGTVLILAGLARLGSVTELLSKPIRYGYMNGIALTVLISQIPKLMGFSIESEGPLRDLWAIGGAILDGKTNWVAFALGLSTLIVILLLQNNTRLPVILIAVVGATLVVGTLGLGSDYGVKVLGPLPRGLPGFTLPWIGYGELVAVLAGGCAIALVSFADTSVLSRTYTMSIRTRRWWGSIWRPAFFRAFRSAAARRARRLRKQPALARNSPASSARLPSLLSCWWHRTSFSICRAPRWPRSLSPPRLA